MSPIFLMSGIGMMLVGILAVVYWKIKSKIRWALFFWGVLAWIIAVVLKSIAALPTKTIISYLRDTLPKYLSEPIIWIYSGLLTGIFECGVTLAFVYLIRRVKESNWKESVGFGLGFGSIEAFLVGAGSFVLTYLAIFMPSLLPPEILKQATSGPNSPLIIPAPVVERITVIFLHALSCLLIIFAVQTKNWRWFWISFVYKTAIDTIAGYILFTYRSENLTVAGTWIVELALLPFGIIGAWGLWYFKDKWKISDDCQKNSGSII